MAEMLLIYLFISNNDIFCLGESQKSQEKLLRQPAA